MKAERDFKPVCTGGPYGDCCCSYAVELRGEWTVQEFVKAVLERNPCEWGFFYIQRAGENRQQENQACTQQRRVVIDGLLDRNIKARRVAG